MWPALALAGFKAFQDAQNGKNSVASNVINEKYSPWTGLKGDFSHVGQNTGMGTLMQGLAAGLMAPSSPATPAKAVSSAESGLPINSAADNAKDADFYSKLSADPSSVGVTPVASQGSSAFAAAAKAPLVRAPATTSPPAADQGSLQALMGSSNPWLAASQRPLLPMEAALPDAQRQDPTQATRRSVWGMIPNNLPIKHGWGY